METWTASVPVARIEEVLAPDAPAEAPPASRACGTKAIVDLRTPAEFAEDHIPGAHNVPLFDDEGRAIVGLFFKQFSPEAAFQEARVLAARRIVGLVERVAELAGWEVEPQGLEESLLHLTRNGIESLESGLEPEPNADGAEPRVVLHCWRGGLRSRSVVAFLRRLGFTEAVGLEGGYKSYRGHCRAAIDAWTAPPAFALRGLTGVGKTLVLRALERRRPDWVFDLEAFAGHRSSLLGMVGLEPCSQKTFESRIFDRQRRGFGGAVVFEGESRRVGDAIIPASVWSALQGATNIELGCDRARRVEVLMEDYLAVPAARAELRGQLAKVQARMDKKVQLVELFDAGEEATVVEELLEHYYDPLYRHSERGKEYALRVDSTDPERAAAEIEGWIGARLAERP